MTAYLPDFVENALGASSAELLRLASERPGQLLAQRDNFYASMESSWSGTTADALPKADTSELRPAYGRGLMSSYGSISSHYADSPQQGRIAREVKALLLYAHSTIVVNPLAPWFEMRQGRIYNGRTPNGWDFIRAITAIAELEPLIRDGTILIIDPPEIAWDEDLDLGEAIGTAALALDYMELTGVQRRGTIDEFDQYAATEDALIRLMAYSAIDPHDSLVDFCASPELEGQRIGRLLEAVADALDVRLKLPADQARLAAIMQLSLPGVDSLRPSDMATIRSEDKFLSFRRDMRTALTEVDASLRHGDLLAARRDISEFMRARALELKASSARSRFWKTASSGAINLGVGVALTALADWKAAAIQLLARSVYETVRDRSTQANKALRRHYLALSQSGDSVSNDGGAAGKIHAWQRGLK